ncbi:MAG: DUF4837 family protein [Cytophagales bacterium]|nr:DUF4837 family protein [Cytophagales bacterium]
MKRVSSSLLLISALALTGVSCQSSQSGEEGQSNELLPSAKGRPGEIVLIMDSTLWRGLVGEQIRSVFQKYQVGLPQNEPLFTLSRVDPGKFNHVLEQVHNLVFVTTFDVNTPSSNRLKSFFTAQSMERIKADSSLFMYTKEDQFARGQQVLYLFGLSQQQLANHISKNAGSIRALFNDAERERWISRHQQKSEKKLTAHLRQKMNLSLTIPFGFELADEKEDFIWLRRMEGEVDKSIFVTQMPYTSERQFDLDSLIAIRNRVGKQYIWGSDSLSYLETELNYDTCYTREVNFSGAYAVEVRGLWKLHNNAMGGPFVAYAVVNEATNTFTYAESFVYAPGGTKREELREMEAALWTLSFPKP